MVEIDWTEKLTGRVTRIPLMVDPEFTSLADIARDVMRHIGGEPGRGTLRWVFAPAEECRTAKADCLGARTIEHTPKCRFYSQASPIEAVVEEDI